MGDVLQRALGVSCVVADKGASDDGAAPDIIMFYLSRGDVELAMQARQQRFEPAAFLFERSAAGYVDVYGQYAE